MKAKTVWENLEDRWAYRGLSTTNEIWCSSYADIRWVNCFGYRLGNVSLDSIGDRLSGKIIGDK